MNAKIYHFPLNGTEHLQALKSMLSWQQTLLHLSEECYDFVLKASLKAASMPWFLFPSTSASETSKDPASA
jgi:hypothetical protein